MPVRIYSEIGFVFFTVKTIMKSVHSIKATRE